MSKALHGGVAVVLVGLVVGGLTLMRTPRLGLSPVTVQPSTSPRGAVEAPQLEFEDVTARAGLTFVHYNGAFGKNRLPETMGAGCAWIDYDNSGRQSLLLLNDTDFADGPRRRPHVPALYRNNGNGTFTDVTRAAGLDFDAYAMGVAVGDYDNDGYPDIFITSTQGNRLFHNRGNGTFEDATASSGIVGPLGPVPWSTSAAFVDYDNDGLLDIFVTYYIKWTAQHDFYHPVAKYYRTYSEPQAYPGQACRLFHNLGGGRFEDVTQKAGLAELAGKGLGISVIMRPDGWPDLYVANDSVPNFYLSNQKDGTFHEEGVQDAVATGEEGLAKNGMGTDVADTDNDGHLSILVGNLPEQMLSLYRDLDHHRFLDVSTRAGLGAPSRLDSSFGCFFFDYDLDGYQDIFVANGLLDRKLALRKRLSFAEEPFLFHNRHDGTFAEVGAQSGLTVPLVGRGAAWADYDGDGWPDFVITTSNGPPHLYHNTGVPGRHSLQITLQGTPSNRSGIGAQVFLTVGHVTQHEWVKSGSSYCSASQLPLLFGLGTATQADQVEVQWPGTAKAVALGAIPAGRVRVVEGQGVVGR